MNEIDNNEIKSILFDISKKYILPKYNNLKDSDIMRKQNNDLVTSVDIYVEEKLNKILTKILPNSLFVGEEKFSKFPKIIEHYTKNQYCWTVDPIDGTTNFTKGKNKFAIMIALTFGNHILQSWIYMPITGDICSAIEGQGSYINEKKLLKNQYCSLQNSRGSISSKYWDENIQKKLKKLKTFFAEVNSYGCIGYEYVDIAKGDREFAIISKLSPWDHLPGILFLREVCGFDSYFDNGSYSHCMQKQNLVVAKNTKIGEKILSLIRSN